jgi:hypothetical protein
MIRKEGLTRPSFLMPLTGLNRLNTRLQMTHIRTPQRRKNES